jgi:hypothetical protein
VYRGTDTVNAEHNGHGYDPAASPSPIKRTELTLRRLATTAVIASLFALAITMTAYGEGAQSIAGAPTVVDGQQEFGTLSVRGTNCVYASWWLLPVVVGDTVQIDWEVQDGGVHLHLWAPGTNDFNYATRESLRSEPNPNLKTEYTFQATQTGTMPMRFAVGERCSTATVPGPYSFTVNITHVLNVALPFVSALRSKGSLTVGVHTPEGGPVRDPAVRLELQIKGRGAWQTIGVGTAVRPVIAYRVPSRLRHSRHVTLRVLAHGQGYSPASSAHLKIRTL